MFGCGYGATGSRAFLFFFSSEGVASNFQGASQNFILLAKGRVSLWVKVIVKY